VTAYVPGSSLAHGLDPRAKLAVQVSFVAAVYAAATPAALVGASLLAAGILRAADVAPADLAATYRPFLPFLAAAPLLEALTLGPPWVEPAAAVGPAVAAYQVLLAAAVAAAYVRTTTARETRAALQWAVPGRVGVALGTGIGLVVRFLPLVRADLRRAQHAEAARLGDERPVRERMVTVATAGLRRALGRADRLGVALQARCLSWNPTLPPLGFEWRDAPAVGLAVLLAVAAVASVAGVL
jgi:biotin transport system permease protein